MSETLSTQPGHLCIALLAHVDAGKTTLSEAMLYRTGQIRKLGRVDHQDAYLDHDVQERERGITIFSKQARIVDGDWRVTLLDTPGHVDFSAEMERTLQVLDLAVLVISGTDGVQGHTRTLWRLLRHYRIPAFLFVNKMDLGENSREQLMEELREELSDCCVDFSEYPAAGENAGEYEDGALDEETEASFYEEIALCSEELLNEYTDSGRLSLASIQCAIRERRIFPCYFGSALKLDGVEELLAGLKRYAVSPEYSEAFSARVYKVGRDERGARLTYLKLTGGSLAVKDIVEYSGRRMEYNSSAEGETQEVTFREKIDQIRIYSGERYETTERVAAGEVCAVTGLTATFPGLGLGASETTMAPVLEPVLTYRIFLPDEVNPVEMMGKLKLLEEEEPQLHILWNESLREIHVQMMGQVQIEVLTRLIKDRFGVTVVFGQGNIVYKETVAGTVEGIGHFEPLRHYAEVHLLLEPGEPGSGIQVASACSEDVLDLNWQRLIATHILEREHPGVLTGSALTDVKFTILTGRAHLKHTEGGDFRQATYRAIRQGLKSTDCVLLEPYYRFVLEVPMEQMGRAMTDLQQRFAKGGDHPESPQIEYLQGRAGESARISGRAPVATMQDYMSVVQAYTGGLGSLALVPDGYDVCHNSAEVLAERAYDSEADTANPTGSVFCAHGAGFVVPWDEVDRYMHMERVWKPDTAGIGQASDGYSYQTEGNAYGTADLPAHSTRSWEKSVASMTSLELDQELADVYAREFGMNREALEEEERRKWATKKDKPKEAHVKLDKKGNPIYPAKKVLPDLLIVDGYNIIFAWPELKRLSETNIDSARDALKDILLNYQGYTRCRLLVVFDAYKVKGNTGKKEFYDGLSRKERSSRPRRGAGKPVSDKNGGSRAQSGNSGTGATELPVGIEVVYTREDETADAYIERTVYEARGKYRVTVATSDGMEQMTVLSMGALRMSAMGLKEEIDRTSVIVQ